MTPSNPVTAEMPEGFVETLNEPNSDGMPVIEELDVALLVNSAERIAMLADKYPDRFDEKDGKRLTHMQKQLGDMSKRIQFPPAKRNKPEGTTKEGS
jgi:hypothetical protein